MNIKILLLGGNSARNRAWLNSMKIALIQEGFNNVIGHEYLHWDKDYSLVNFNEELKHIKIVLKDYDQYIVIAKSAGTLLALKGIYETTILPLVCIFLGTAILWGREKGLEIDHWLENCSVPTFYIHNSYDPAIKANNLRILLEKRKVKNYELLVLPGSKHKYSECQKIVQNIKSFLIPLQHTKINCHENEIKK